MKIRPFSAWRYILNNKARAMALILMMMFITVSFTCGMYVDNAPEIFRISTDFSDQYVLIYRSVYNTESNKQFKDCMEELPEYLGEGEYERLNVGLLYCEFQSIMEFNCNMESFVFESEEDFETFKSCTTLVPEDLKLKDCEIAMSEYLANNGGYKVGQPLNAEEDLVLTQTVSSWKGVRAYAVERNVGDCALIINREGVRDHEREKRTAETLSALSEKLSSKYPLLSFDTPSRYMDSCKADFEFMYYIFGAASLLLDIVLLVTINAAFTAAYDKRKHEFAIYKAMGFTRGQIFRKVASEVLLLNAFAILIGAIVNAGVILVCNQLMWSQGQCFYRISKFAVVATIISEAVLLVCIILLNWLKTRKYEVTEE